MLKYFIYEAMFAAEQGGPSMPPLTVMIKPVSSACNMRCRYCFYTDVAHNRQQASLGRMSDETLEHVVR